MNVYKIEALIAKLHKHSDDCEYEESVHGLLGQAAQALSDLLDEILDSRGED